MTSAARRTLLGPCELTGSSKIGGGVETNAGDDAVFVASTYDD